MQYICFGCGSISVKNADALRTQRPMLQYSVVCSVLFLLVQFFTSASLIMCEIEVESSPVLFSNVNSPANYTDHALSCPVSVSKSCWASLQSVSVFVSRSDLCKGMFACFDCRGIVSHSDGEWDEPSTDIFFYLTPMDEQVSGGLTFLAHYNTSHTNAEEMVAVAARPFPSRLTVHN